MPSEARKALELTPPLPEALEALGSVAATYDYDWKGAEWRYARAMVDGAVFHGLRRGMPAIYLLPVGRLRKP